MGVCVCVYVYVHACVCMCVCVCVYVCEHIMSIIKQTKHMCITFAVRVGDAGSSRSP